MNIGASLFLTAIGAILLFAVDDKISGVELSTIGLILVIVGIVGLLVSLLVLAPRRRAVIHERPVEREARY